MGQSETGQSKLYHSRLPVPAAAGEVTAGWLQNALSPVFVGIAVEKIDVERIGEAYGLASLIFRCRIAGSGFLESVVIKLWDTGSQAGAREVFFYRTVGQAVGARIPACFHAAVDPDRNRGVLILEDIRPVLQGDCLQQLSLDQAQALARNMAGMHATWMDHTGLQEAEWLRSIIPWERDASWFAPRRALFLERFGHRLDDLARVLLDRIEQAPAVANERLAGAPITLLHAELHLDNVVFERDAEPVVLDWANCAKGPLALDLYNLLFEISQVPESAPVLAAYVRAFAARAGKALDPDVVRRELAGVFLYHFAASTCGVARWQPASPREAAMIDVGIRRTLQALHYWHAHDPALFTFLA